MLTAQSRFSALILTGLPIGVGLFMATFNRTYFDPMLTTDTGRRLLGVVVFLILSGHLIIRRIIRFRV